MLKIGLTGGIGSGKSTVSKMFQALGIPIIDTDIIARQLTQAGETALDSISTQFGSELITPSGELDRKRLRQLIFSDETRRQQLEAILHPLIKAQVLKTLRAYANDAQEKPPYLIIAIPLLFESQWTDLVDRILVVDASVEQQIQRSKNRDNVSEAQVRSIIQQQLDRQSRCAAADDIIHNDSDMANLNRQVLQLHNDYCERGPGQ